MTLATWMYSLRPDFMLYHLSQSLQAVLDKIQEKTVCYPNFLCMS